MVLICWGVKLEKWVLLIFDEILENVFFFGCNIFYLKILWVDNFNIYDVFVVDIIVVIVIVFEKIQEVYGE